MVWTELTISLQPIYMLAQIQVIYLNIKQAWEFFVLVFLLDPNNADGPTMLTQELKIVLRTLNKQPENQKLNIKQLNICNTDENESIALCLAISYELLCNYNKKDFFEKFKDTRNHLYSCLQVSTWNGKQVHNQ